MCSSVGFAVDQLFAEVIRRAAAGIVSVHGSYLCLFEAVQIHRKNSLLLRFTLLYSVSQHTVRREMHGFLPRLDTVRLAAVFDRRT